MNVSLTNEFTGVPRGVTASETITPIFLEKGGILYEGCKSFSAVSTHETVREPIDASLIKCNGGSKVERLNTPSRVSQNRTAVQSQSQGLSELMDAKIALENLILRETRWPHCRYDISSWMARFWA